MKTVMTLTAAKPEPADALVALALCFGAPGASASDAVAGSLACLEESRLEQLLSRAAEIDAEGDAERDAWRDRMAVRLARQPRRWLDPNVNPSQIVDFLSRETTFVRALLIRELSPELAGRMATYLDVPEDALAVPAVARREIVEAAREALFARFISLDDVYQPDDLDRLSVAGLDGFIRHLGLREVATACRGIASKETLAAFLNRFDPADVREIAQYLTQLDKIRPFWVAQADALVGKTWTLDAPPATVVRRIGMRVLAAAYVARDEVKCRYAAQKLAAHDLRNWNRLVKVHKRRYDEAGESGRRPLDKRRRVVEKLAVKFAATGRL